MADSDRQHSKKPPWHQAQDLEQGSFGSWLRQQREARDIELREIADHTKISIRYLDALEKDRFDVLPADLDDTVVRPPRRRRCAGRAPRPHGRVHRR